MYSQLGTVSVDSNQVLVMCSSLRYRRSKPLFVQQMIAEVRVELAKRTSEDDEAVRECGSLKVGLKSCRVL